MPAEPRSDIAAALAAIGTRSLASAATELFSALGYGSDRRVELPSLLAFLSEFDAEHRVAEAFPETAAPSASGDSVLVQQLTSEEIAANSSHQLLLAKKPSGEEVREGIRRTFESYLFVALALPDRSYTRVQLAERARVLNSLFAQPVLLLFRYGAHISLAITYRRANKTDQSRDVVARKVTLIKDIALAEPHSGHLAILEDFSLPALSRARQRDIRTFADLDDAWRESLSTQLLNRQFYKEIANWYFWARDNSTFPKDAPVDADGKPSLPLIRLLTRLIFCWFLREKSLPRGGTLIPADLFDPPRIREFLRDASPDATTYYTGIVQNLFFATLNAEMDKEGQPHHRHFIGEGEDDEPEEHFNAAVWRNKQLLAQPEKVEGHFRRIPFLNGGLFECLDEPVFNDKGKKIGERRVDGFSTRPAKQAKVPNFLFFGADRTADLSTAYGDSGRSKETVRPLLEIFRSYKFTLTENTPIEEEVALDPELLGHVFENLLAAFNPETGTIARKATGSFYTPRIVVDWMVDEALVVHLAERVPTAAEAEIRDLLSWESDTHDVPPATVSALIDAIDSLKSLDPACGSGAFPMGLLQKLVHLLKKLDPENEGWRARQTAAAEAIESAPARQAATNAIVRAFARDDDDYGRKLYLIENCLYGVDIQPIAVQIAKLRFFIALVVDQPIVEEEPNYGILPLPNLETKIVAANTLLGLRRGQLMLGSNEVRALERQLQQIRHDYFTARRYADKKDLRARDRELCRQLATALANSGECTPADAQRLADWNPYDTNREASFFDPGWMFGLAVGRQRPSAATLRGNMAAIINQTAGQLELGSAPVDHGAGNGFDLILGNPPYVRQEELKNVSVQDSAGRPRPLKHVLKEQYECFTGTADLYVYFIERSLQLLRTGGVLSFITSNKYFRAAYGERLRTYLLYATRPRVILDFGDAPLFTAIAYPCVLVVQKTRAVEKGKLPPSEKFASEATFGQLISNETAAASIRVFPWTPGPPLRDFPAIFADESFDLTHRELKPGGWRLEAQTSLRLLERTRAAGQPLGEHCGGRIYRGIISGLNEAFFIDEETRQRLIDEDESSADLIRPLLRGRDIKRWRINWQKNYVIVFPFGFHTQLKKFPAIYAHLESLEDKLKARGQCQYSRGGKEGGQHHWLELDNNPSPTFLSEFTKPKILIPAISDTVNFAADQGEFYCNNKASICIPPNAGFACGVLNSRVNANPRIWDFRNLPVGGQQTYTAYNEKGHKRQKFRYFSEVAPGDLLVGYLTTPDKEVAAICEITKALHATAKGDAFEFQKIEQVEQPITWAELQTVASLTDCEPVKSNQGSLFALTEDEFDAIRALIDERNPVTPPPQRNVFTKADALDGLFMDAAQLDTILARLTRKKGIILQGPPGVGKTFVARRLAYALMGEQDESRVCMVQFHPSYGYEDFIQGYRPDGTGLRLRNGVFHEFARRARHDGRPCFFIIDEINRGNLAKIFGELLMLLEADKRGPLFAMPLTYADSAEETFWLPENLHVIGTMNTADRSLAMVDYALRRRFAFVTLDPALHRGEFRTCLLGKGAPPALADQIAARVGRLNDEISAERDLGRGFRIGHSYFCPAGSPTDWKAWYRDIIEAEIAPLLEEYFDNDVRLGELTASLLAE
jgi:MoxR-like ATPase